MDVAIEVLSVYSWALTGMLVVFLWRIGYFYEKASGERLHHYLLIGPGLLLAVGAIWYIVHGAEFVGQPIGDGLLFFGGLGLVLFALRMQHLMTGPRR